MNKRQGKFLWLNLNRAKNYQNELSIEYGFKLLDIDMAIIIFTADHMRVTISKIEQTKYFRGYAFSTIKRSVDRLIKQKVLKQTKDTIDARKRILSLTLEDWSCKS